MSKETLFLAEINDRVVNFTTTVKAVLTGQQQLTAADILNYYLNASRLRPDLMKSPQKLVQWNLESGFPIITASTPKQISQLESGGKKYLSFETSKARDDILSLGLIEEDSSEDQPTGESEGYLQPIISKVSDWLEDLRFENPIKALRLSIESSSLRRVITEFLGKESPDPIWLIRSPQKRKVRAFLSSLQNQIRYPFGNLYMI